MLVVTAPVGSYTNDNSNLSSSVGNVVPNATTSLTVQPVNFEVEKTSNPADGSEVQPGDTIMYTITIRNLGATAQTAFTFDDDLSDVLDNGTLTGSPTITPSSAGSVTQNGTTLTFVGDIPAGDTATFTYTARVNDNAPAGASLRNVIVGDFSSCVTGEDPGCITEHEVVAVDGSLADTGRGMLPLLLAAGGLIGVSIGTVFKRRLVSMARR